MIEMTLRTKGECTLYFATFVDVAKLYQIYEDDICTDKLYKLLVIYDSRDDDYYLFINATLRTMSGHICGRTFDSLGINHLSIEADAFDHFDSERDLLDASMADDVKRIIADDSREICKMLYS